MPSRFLSLLLACLTIISCGVPDTSGQLGPSNGIREQKLQKLGYTSLPLRRISSDSRYSGRFLVNGKPVNLLIDSGANSTDLDSKLAVPLGLKIDETTKVVSRGALGRPVTSSVGLGVLSAGPVSAFPFPFMLAQDDLGTTATSRYNGQLGLDALEAIGALVDLRTGLMWVPGRNAPNSRRERILPLGAQNELGFTTLRMRPAGNLPHLVLESEWNGRLITWIVDTGAEVSVLSTASAEALGLATVPSSSRIIDASGDNASVRHGVFENVYFDRLVLAEFQVAVTSLPVVRKNFRDRNGRTIDGIIGMDFLSNTAALFDAGTRLLYVGDPEQTPSQPARPTIARQKFTAPTLGLRLSQ